MIEKPTTPGDVPMYIDTKYRKSGKIDLRRLRRCARRLRKVYRDLGLGKTEKWLNKAARRFNK